MYGGLGDDVYLVDAASELVVESANEGFDTVRSERRFLAPRQRDREPDPYRHAAVAGTGNLLDNVITGNAVGKRARRRRPAATPWRAARAMTFTGSMPPPTSSVEVAGDGIGHRSGVDGLRPVGQCGEPDPHCHRR
jgi:serralysin